MKVSLAAGQIQSEALIKNLDLTNVEVDIEPVFEVLQDAVRGYAGKERQAWELLVEYHHKYRNWRFVISETWRYAVSNLRLISSHPSNGAVIYLLSRIFVDALTRSERPEIRGLAANNLIAFWLKLVDEMPAPLSRPLPEGAAVSSLDDTFMSHPSCHEGVVRHYFQLLRDLPRGGLEDVMRSYYQLKKLGGKLLNVWSEPASFEEIRGLLTRLYRETYQFWLDKEDPCQWLMGQAEAAGAADPPWFGLCTILGHEEYLAYLRRIDDEIEPVSDHREAVARLVQLPDFHEIERTYFKLPETLKAYEDPEQASPLSMLIRLKIMEIRGLEGIHEETLREINFEIAHWVRRKQDDNLQKFLEKVLDVLSICLRNYPEAALQIVRTIGLEVIDSGDRVTTDFFLKRIIGMGFQLPKLGRVSQYWQMETNPAHLPNIRIWLEIIKKSPSRTRALLSALILNLSLGGIYVRDTDLFQKDVSQLLHAPIRSVYNLVKQLAKLFPVYFNQIGAEGQLRDVSTDVDEMTGRSDRLIHFLRKQSHVESNNVIVRFIEAIIQFWRTLDKSGLQDRVPPEIYPEIATSGPLVDDMHRIMESIFQSNTIHHVKDLLELTEEESQELVNRVPDVSERERRRAFLTVQLYQLLHEKYALSFKDMRQHLQRASTLGLPDPGRLLGVLDSSDAFEKLDAILDYLEEIREVILTPGEMNILENIYYKRHIAVDIPSMYGSYNERKFDALGLTFRLENLANVLFEEIIYAFDLSFITRASFFRIGKFLPLFIKALAIDGITSNRLELQAELFYKSLEVRRFSHSQYIDIFRGFSEAIKQIIQTNYHAVHEENLDTIIRQLGSDSLLARYQRETESESPMERVQRVSESFLRDIIARTFGLQYFDHFISSILTTLATQKEELSSDMLDLLLSYDPEKTLTMVYKPKKMVCDIIHMGNKGYNLANLHSIGIQVPPAFVITTEYFRCRSVIESFSQSSQDFEDRVMAHIHKLEDATGREYGSRTNAMLISVRSGAAVSMPGMMTTFLNVGINEEVVEGLVAQTGEDWFAWDNYRRFIQSWGMSFGMQRGEFDAIMRSFKQRHKRDVKREFMPVEIRDMALAYKRALMDHNIAFSDDPKEQLFTAIRQVMASWYYPKAKTYREIMGLSENWGTAVAIQAMVFGNLDTRSGAGVMFTHNPRTSEDEIDPVGDFTWGNQGEDVVGGLVQTLPLSEKQRLGARETQEFSLETLFPRVYRRLVQVARMLIIEHSWSPQEIEFTFQGDDEDGVYVLQSRNMAPRERRHLPVFEISESLQSSYVGSGIGVSGGALAGLAAFSMENIEHLRREHPGGTIILIRSDTVPEDIHEIFIADGILTGKGGATSHAAIVAHRLGKTCVVGFNKMRVWERKAECLVDGHVIRTGDGIAIDGRSGAIYLGIHETQQVDLTG
ncbi:MAG: PEP-utilizing enzyme [Syntrophobacteraceae bacterium]|jgi:pyruvate,orthophosphate dikinase|nr:PEP-utilizing enzyme [Syntrophobacteraceae bacterium]